MNEILELIAVIGGKAMGVLADLDELKKKAGGKAP